MGHASQHFLNLSKRFAIVRLFGTFHLLPTKILKDKQNKTEECADNFGLRPNLFLLQSPPLSVSSLVFLCFTVVRKCHYTKKVAMLQITVFVI